MAGFGNALAGMDAAIEASLSDGLGDYVDPSGQPVVRDLKLMLDHELMINGAEGVFRSDAIGITWRKAALPKVAKGGRFSIGACRYVVEDTLSDDGRWITAACMESR
jgi:hypothetical protein